MPRGLRVPSALAISAPQASCRRCPMSSFPERVFSGMQPTRTLHLGNYLGAMVNWIRMQETHDCLYCVVDMHAITVFQEPKELTDNIREVTAAYLANVARSNDSRSTSELRARDMKIRRRA